MRGYRRVLRLRGGARRELEREMAEEVEAHLAMRIDDLVRGGMSQERARAVALDRFGDRSVLMRTVVERERRLSRGERMQNLARDLKLAWRHARREPGTSALTVATFALGIGLTTAMFTVVDRVLLRPLPFGQPERLVALWGEDEHGDPISRVSFEDWSDLRERNRTLASTAIHRPSDVTVLLGGRGRLVAGALVSHEFFDVLRAPLVAGRGFDAADRETGAVVVSASLWRTQLGGEPLDGLALDVDGLSMPVVGVAAAAETYLSDAQVWVLDRGVRRGGGLMRNNINWNAIARLAPGVSADQAEADLRGVAAGIRAVDPVGEYMHGVNVEELRSVIVSDASESIVLLFGAVSLVLLIGCSNIAALTLARAARRRADIATRFALGASRSRVFRQLLTEQLVLAMTGGLAGVFLARDGIRLITVFAAGHVPRLDEVGIDVRVLLFAFLASLLAGALAGWLPALRASAVDPHTLMARRGVVSGGRRFAGATLLTAEVAIAITLVIGGGLLLRSLLDVIDRDVGFSAAGVAAAHVVLAPADYAADPAAAPRFWDDLIAGLRTDPSVASVALANWVPTGTAGTTFLEVEGVDGRDASGAAYRVVSDDYFETLRMPVRGRSFDASDAAGGERVAMINGLLAEKYWPEGGAIGARIRTPGMEGYRDVPWLRVVGITSDVRHGGHESEPTAHVYVLQRQRTEHRAMHVLVRAADGQVATATRALERAVGSIDTRLAVEPRDLERELASLTRERRLFTGVLGAFATLALLLAATGTFGLFSYAVAQRTHEFAVRNALGAGRSSIVLLVLGDALRLVGAGCLAGSFAAFWLTRLLEAHLSGVSAADPLTYAVALGVILGAALIAAAGPSIRASSVDPQTALRGV